MSTAAPGSSWAIKTPVGILVLLALVNFINYADRQLIAPLAPLLEQPIEAGGLGLSKAQIGLLFTAFMLVHSLASVPLGLLADRFARRKLIAVGVGLWSVATAMAGLTQNFVQLFLARSSIGIGEATYAPAASALLSERFPPHNRARALGVFQIGMVLGGAAALIIGGTVAAAWGWRAAFLIFGLPGLVLAVLSLYIDEPPMPARTAETPSLNLMKELKVLFASRGFLWINISGIFITFFVGALLAWSTTFVLEAHYGGDPDKLGVASRTFGILAGIGAISGAILGSWLADRIESKRPGDGRVLSIAIGTFACVPCVLVSLWVSSTNVGYLTMSLAVFFASWYVGPILAALHEFVPETKRGLATGVYLFLIHVLGDAISPFIVGLIAERTGSLRTGLVVATVVLALGAFAALAALPAARTAAALRGESAPPLR